jgi:hypothetical protein
MWKYLRSLFVSPPEPIKPPSYTITEIFPPTSTQELWINASSFPDLRDQKPHVFLFNLSEQSFEAGSGVLGTVKLPGRSPNEPYRFLFSLPKQIISPHESSYGSDVVVITTPGIRVAVDLINPDNPGNSLNDGPEYSLLSEGRDLSKKGVFISMSNPPAQEDIEVALARLKN